MSNNVAGGGRYFAPEVPRSANSITTTYERDDDEVPGAGPSEREEAAPFLGSNGTTRVDMGKVGTGSAEGQKAANPAKWLGLPSILAYCASSIMMTVANKFIVLDKKFNLNLVVLFMQSLIGVLLVVFAERMKWIQLRGLNRKDVTLWMPISTLLVFVIYTGSKAIQHLNISVYTIFKNLTIILIAYGEVVWFQGKVTCLTMLAFLLMVSSSVIAAWSDIAHISWLQNLPVPHLSDASLYGGTKDPVTGKWVQAPNPLQKVQDGITAQLKEAGISDDGAVFENMASGAGGVGAGGLSWGTLKSGYVWMAANCLCSAAYVLLMRKRIKVTGFKDWDTMFYNNLLTLPVLLVLSLIVEDWSKANFDFCFPQEKRAQLFTAIGFSGFCAMFISWSTAWCIRVTSSTTYSMVGALNKLPLALSGMVFFAEKATFGNGLAIAVGFFAGIVYAYAKVRQGAAQKQSEASAALPLHKIQIDNSGRRD